jgi:hypothetical protein
MHWSQPLTIGEKRHFSYGRKWSLFIYDGLQVGISVYQQEKFIYRFIIVKKLMHDSGVVRQNCETNFFNKSIG